MKNGSFSLALHFFKAHSKGRSSHLLKNALENKKLREPFLPKFTEVETPQVTPAKLPYGTRKHPLSAATFPS